MKMELLEDTLVSTFMETPIKRNLSRKERKKCVRRHKLRDGFTEDQYNRFDTIQNHLLNSKADYEDFKEWSIKKWKRMKIGF